MENILTYVPLIIDVIAIVFLILCLKLGYDDGLSKVIKRTGVFSTMVLSAWLAKLIFTFMTPVVKLFNMLLNGIEMSADTRAMLASFIVLTILFVLFFVLLMTFWGILNKKTVKFRNKISGKPLDKILGLIVVGILGVLLIAFLSWVFYDVTYLIDSTQMENTIIVNFISNVF